MVYLYCDEPLGNYCFYLYLRFDAFALLSVLLAYLQRKLGGLLPGEKMQAA
jgi:hypothetical protein